MLEKFYYSNEIFALQADLQNGMSLPNLGVEFGDAHLRYLDQNLLEKHFAGNKSMLRFLQAGAIGILIETDDTWLTVGWFRTPATGSFPYQLPAKWRSKNVFWIFSCRTNSNFRNKGLYTFLLRSMIAIIRRDFSDHAEIYIDTATDNIAAKKAIVKVGFKSLGRSRYLRIPILNIVFELDRI